MNPPSPEIIRTVLVVDGNGLVRQLLADALSHGARYSLLTADDGPQALQLSREFTGEIHLLLTGFQLPGMSGIELATAMATDRPKLIVLIMSGFPEEALVLNEHWHFLPKPFIASELRALVARLIFPCEKWESVNTKPST